MTTVRMLFCSSCGRFVGADRMHICRKPMMNTSNVAKRYTPIFSESELAQGIRMEEDENGKWRRQEDYAALESELAKLREQVEKGMKSSNEVEQIAGKALGYPWYKDHKDTFPDATEANGVCVGDHVAESIVMELAKRYVDYRQRLKEFEQDLEKVISSRDMWKRWACKERVEMDELQTKVSFAFKRLEKVERELSRWNELVQKDMKRMEEVGIDSGYGYPGLVEKFIALRVEMDEFRKNALRMDVVYRFFQMAYAYKEREGLGTVARGYDVFERFFLIIQKRLTLPRRIVSCVEQKKVEQ